MKYVALARLLVSSAIHFCCLNCMRVQMASHAGGGTPGVSDRYASLFFYMDSLSAAAAANFSGFLRQDLTGASYGLIQGCALTTGGAGTSEPAPSWSAYNQRYGWVAETGTCQPNPDYWGALLWRRLMGRAGQRVVNVTATIIADDAAALRVYGHCGASADVDANDMTLLLINLLNQTQGVSLRGISSSGHHTEYVLTPGEPVGQGWASCCISQKTGMLDETKTPCVVLAHVCGR